MAFFFYLFDSGLAVRNGRAAGDTAQSFRRGDVPAVQRLHHCVWVVRQNSQTLGLQLLLTPAASWVEQDSCCRFLLQKLGQGQGDGLGTTLTLGCPLISAPLLSQAGLSTRDAFLDLLISASELGGGGL